MQQPVATTEIDWLRPNGDRTKIVVGVGMPYLDDGNWRCPVGMDGLHERLPPTAAEDSLHALTLALLLIERRLRHLLEDGGRLLCVGTDDDFPLDAYFGAWRPGQNADV